MKTIILEKAYSILENCSAVIRDEDVLIYVRLESLENMSTNEWLYLSWEIGGREFTEFFNEGDNQSVVVEGGTFHFKNTEEEITLITPLFIKDMEKKIERWS